MKVVITDFIKLDPESRQRLEKIPDIKIYDDADNDPKVIIDRIKDAEIITASYIDITSEIIGRCPKLKYIISPAVGSDWIDKKAATDHEIKILNCPSFNSQAVAEHAIALMFAVKRKIVQAHESLINGTWAPKEFIGTEIKDKHLVTIGHGNIGKKIATMAVGLGMKTSYSDSKTSDESVNKLLQVADVLVLCLSLNESTRGWLNKQRLNLLKNNCVVINVARGLIIDQEPFYEILKGGKIQGAGIDVFPNDRTIREADESIKRFLKLPNVVGTPHIAYNTIETSQRLGPELLADIESCLVGKPINVINK